MTSRFALGLLLCLAIMGEIPHATAFIDSISEYAKNIIDHIQNIIDFISKNLGPAISDLFQKSKTLAGCANAAKDCGVTSELDHKDPCGSARKIGWCVFNTCPDVLGTEEESTVIQILNGVFNKIPKCEFRAEAMAQEFRERNSGNRQVPVSILMMVASTLMGTAALIKVFV